VKRGASALLTLLLYVGIFAAVSLVSGNNLVACVGTAVGAKILSQRSGALLGASGFALGLLAQGSIMKVSAHALLPYSNITLSAETLLITVVVFLVAHRLRVPLSLTMSLVGLLAGLSIAGHEAIAGAYVTSVVAMWFAAPILSTVVVFYSIRAIGKTKPTNVWRRVEIYKIFLIALSFLTSYVLGANTMGLILAIAGFNTITILIAILGIFVGSFYFSAGVLRRVGEELFLLRYSSALVTLLVSALLVELATVFGIPLSTTQTLSAGVFGAGLSYKHKFMSTKPFLIIMLGWVVAPVISFVIGLLLYGL
jgi:inorganic phosphate transporter, PiT family